MKKSGLKEMKNRNRQMLVQTILEQGALSRVELAQKTELSPSTVSSLIGELLEDGVLVESGVRVSTAGRSRTELAINGAYGNIIIVEIAREGSTLHIFDMALQKERMMRISDGYIAGNELLIALTAAVFKNFDSAQIKAGKIAGFGLLFQEDMQASEFNVMYSTGFSAANISLREALVTQFRVPVVEEYSQSYTLTNALAGMCRADETVVQNSAHLAIGTSVLASVTLEGKPVRLREGQYANLTPLLGDAIQQIPQLAASQKKANDLQKQSGGAAALIAQLSATIAMLCTLFPLDIVFLSGRITANSGFVASVSAQVARVLRPVKPPKIETLAAVPHSVADEMAQRIRNHLLCTV